MRDTKTVLLALLSIGLVGTWIYHLYDKSQYSRQYPLLLASDSAAIASAIRDSLDRHYTSALSELDNKLATSRNSSDSLQNRLALRLREITQLRSEIFAILNKQHLSQSELATANQKMAVLQQKIGELKEENSALEMEKQQFSQAVQQLTQNTDSLQNHIRKLSGENAVLQQRMSNAMLFVTTEMKLAAMNIRSTKEEETFQVKKADKFVVSFVLQNNTADQPNSEVAIVIKQPDGQILQNSKWESGTFTTANREKKNYTRLVKFDYAQGEKMDISFSLEVEQFQKGNYLLQIWQKGSLIGSAVTALY